jgi:hypothetical protein
VPTGVEWHLHPECRVATLGPRSCRSERKWNRWQTRKEWFRSAVYWAWALFGVSRQNIRRKIKSWIGKNLALWRGPCGTQRQARGLIPGPNLAIGARLLSFNRTQSRAVIGLLTGHNTLIRHLHVMGLSADPTCRKCGTEEETSVHILCECEALASLRHRYLGSFFWTRGMLGC